MTLYSVRLSLLIKKQRHRHGGMSLHVIMVVLVTLRRKEVVLGLERGFHPVAQGVHVLLWSLVRLLDGAVEGTQVLVRILVCLVFGRETRVVFVGTHMHMGFIDWTLLEVQVLLRLLRFVLAESSLLSVLEGFEGRIAVVD